MFKFNTNVIASGVVMTVIAICSGQERKPLGADYFENHIRPILVAHCYECHSEQAGQQQGGLLLDRQSGWVQGGHSGRAVVPNSPESSLLIEAVGYSKPDLEMPPEQKLPDESIKHLEAWIRGGAPGPLHDPGETKFSRLGDQELLFAAARKHWAFQPAIQPPAPSSPFKGWNENAIDQWIAQGLVSKGLTPSPPADARTLVRRTYFDLVGLPPSRQQVEAFELSHAQDAPRAMSELVDKLLQSPEYGTHCARMWLDVARYADTDSFYRLDTRTPHYFPFAFTYRDYVIDAFNGDKPFSQFVKEQLSADLIGFDAESPEIAALGFLAVGPHANRSQEESLDDWIDVTTRGLMGLTVACARCHDHKYEPIPTADYYALRGVFASVNRIDALDEKKLPRLSSYNPTAADREAYLKERNKIDAKIAKVGGQKVQNKNQPAALKIRETELAELLLFHPGAPAHAMVVSEKSDPPPAFVFVRGDASARGEPVSRRFLRVLEPEPKEFPANASGRKELAERIVDPNNPLTARVYVNRVWGQLMGSYLVTTASDFGYQGAAPSHPHLLDWLAIDFINHGWSTKHLVKMIVSSQCYQQQSCGDSTQAELDPENIQLWRANRKRLSIEELRDSLLCVSGDLDLSARGRPASLWGEHYTRRRAVYGFINRFNLDPTLLSFDFPSPMQSHPQREESIVAPQALFAMNSPIVRDQASSLVRSPGFGECGTDRGRVEYMFWTVLQRAPQAGEVQRVLKFVTQQTSPAISSGKNSRPTALPWELAVQALMMSNEFQYVD